MFVWDFRLRSHTQPAIQTLCGIEVSIFFQVFFNHHNNKNKSRASLSLFVLLERILLNSLFTQQIHTQNEPAFVVTGKIWGYYNFLNKSQNFETTCNCHTSALIWCTGGSYLLFSALVHSGLLFRALLSIEKL